MGGTPGSDREEVSDQDLPMYLDPKEREENVENLKRRGKKRARKNVSNLGDLFQISYKNIQPRLIQLLP